MVEARVRPKKMEVKERPEKMEAKRNLKRWG